MPLRVGVECGAPPAGSVDLPGGVRGHCSRLSPSTGKMQLTSRGFGNLCATLSPKLSGRRSTGELHRPRVYVSLGEL